ncbi:hypothetical protein CTI14_23660 [Methylobacterium radiotolerans]|nr:hypothetical protein CTI14_23660 [Methylobacterium radiotolerans]
MPRRRAFGCGVAATVAALVGILPTAIVFVLAARRTRTTDGCCSSRCRSRSSFGGIALVLGVIGLVFARADGGGYAWPVVGAVLGARRSFPPPRSCGAADLVRQNPPANRLMLAIAAALAAFFVWGTLVRPLFDGERPSRPRSCSALGWHSPG